jgi:hypothetical protein
MVEKNGKIEQKNGFKNFDEFYNHWLKQKSNNKSCPATKVKMTTKRFFNKPGKRKTKCMTNISVDRILFYYSPKNLIFTTWQYNCDKGGLSPKGARFFLKLAAAFGKIWRKNYNMKWNKKFDYPPSIRSLINDQRHYDIGEEKLPSVTTILQATQSPEEKKAILAKWKQNVGEIKADQIRDTAAARGTVMHRIIEGYLTDEGHVDLSDMGQLAGQMAQKVFKDGLKGSMEEIWGSEITLYYPGLYAGATDLVGIYEGRESIIDFKQSNKPKRREWIEDYFTQLAAYATAHNHVYDTKIQSGVILMCTPNMYFQKFVVSDDEFQGYMWKWLKRVDEFCNRDRLHENEGSLQKSE